MNRGEVEPLAPPEAERCAARRPPVGLCWGGAAGCLQTLCISQEPGGFQEEREPV